MKKKLLKYLPLAILALFWMGAASQCGTTPTVVTPAPGPVATALGDAKDAQISDLKKETVALTEKVVEQQKLNAAAAGAVHGIQTATPHITAEQDLPAKEAVEIEAEVAAKALGVAKDAPASVVAEYATKAFEAEKRVNLSLTKQRDAALKARGEALGQVDVQKAKVTEKDKAIADLEGTIKTRDGTISQLKLDADTEKTTAANTLRDALKAKDDKIHDLIDEQAKHERSIYVNTIRCVAGALILFGILAIALTKGEMIIQGAIMACSGLGGIFIAAGLDTLLRQAWFPYAFGVVVLAGGSGFAWWLWRMFKAHQLATKATAVFDDIQTEAAITGNAVWNQVKEHVDYRGLGDTLKKQAVRLGLSSPKELAPATPPQSGG